MGYMVEYYETENGRVIVEDWLDELDDIKAKANILKRITKIEEDGHLGDHKDFGEGISELRFHMGPGYRVYYSNVEEQILLLLCAGDKSKQKANIIKAKEYLKDFKERTT